jgi:N-acyl-D-aspartate/D-glutamate deacylase
MHDLVIRGGTIVDGTGAEPRTGDVAIDGDRIVACGGRVDGAGRQELDADGLLVTPGLVDVHTHYDGQVSWDPLLSPSCWHGVTTVVMGNCGVGFAPVAPDRHDWLIGLMEGVEDIPGAVLHEGITWGWESFPEYLDVIERIPRAIDVGAQLPHGALRPYVMGERGADHRQHPTDTEIATMARLTTEAIIAGALGFTTSRTINHKTRDGELTPSLTATAAELLGIAGGLREAGAGVMEIICDWDDLDAEFDLVRRMVVASGGRPISITVLQNPAAPTKWRRLLDHIEAANRDGLPMQGQVAARPVGLVMGLESRVHPFKMCPSYMAIDGLPLVERLDALRRPETRTAILADARGHRLGLADLTNTFPLGDPPDYEPRPEDSVAGRAAATGIDPLDVAYDWLTGADGHRVLYVPVMNYPDGNCESTREMLLSPATVPGLGDAGAHCTLISDGSFPTYLLTHWGRDRTRGELLPVPWLIKRQTADTARLVGLHDRGVLAPGYKADVNLIEWDALAISAPRIAYDLPTGGKRLLQSARGYRSTIVSGEVAFVDGESTGSRTGHLVRGAQAGPSLGGSR